MLEIKIIFFALASFLGIKDARIAADKTTVIIHTQSKEVEIIQEGLFTVLQTGSDTSLVLNEWEKILEAQENKQAWAKDLDSLRVEQLSFPTSKDGMQAHLRLRYSKEKDLSALGIWYKEEQRQFSINNIPPYNINTNDGQLEGNYWVFEAKDSLSFSIAPFDQMPEMYKKLKVPLEDFLAEAKKE